MQGYSIAGMVHQVENNGVEKMGGKEDVKRSIMEPGAPVTEVKRARFIAALPTRQEEG